MNPELMSAWVAHAPVVPDWVENVKLVSPLLALSLPAMKTMSHRFVDGVIEMSDVVADVLLLNVTAATSSGVAVSIPLRETTAAMPIFPEFASNEREVSVPSAFLYQTTKL